MKFRSRNLSEIFRGAQPASSLSPASEREKEQKFTRELSAKEETERLVGEYQESSKRATTPDSRSHNVFENQRSEKARQLLADIERVAQRPYNILITGETGTGKTLAARQIHQRSARAEQPFLELNCANLPEHLVEAELFGYRKGAFTGADRDHKGLFEEADGGALFLDEISDIAPAVQNKLLKVIDEKQFKRLGTNHYIHCDVQIIAATSRNLPEMIRRGEFREDIYWMVSDELCKRVSISRRHSPFEDDGECLQRLTPMWNRHRPLFRNVSQGQVEQFEYGFVVRE